MTIVEFLLARIAEDEAAASGVPTGEEFRIESSGSPWRAADHYRRHGPARVLAECEAKRRIVEQCTPLAGIEVRRQTRTLAGDTLRALANVYADHQDFRVEWRL